MNTMYSIACEQRQYKTYILSNFETATQVEVVPERGGIITSWCSNGKDILYLDQERFKSPELSVRGGIPILFPLCGNLPDDQYSVDGKTYKIKQHGFARELPWTVSDQNTDDLAGASLTILLSSNEETKRVYPFDFNLTFTYTLQGNTLQISQEFQNNSAVAMPFSAGFHPYFLCGDKNQLEVAIPSSKYQDNKTKETHTFSGNFDFNQDEIDFAFGNLQNNRTSVVDKDRRLKVTIDYDNSTSWIVFWTVKGKDFYCLEPWTATRNAFNTEKNLTILQPGHTHKINLGFKAEFS